MKNKKILVAMSGGVDSSVAAFLLKKSGFKVIGAYMKCWDYSTLGCTGSQDERDARLAAIHIKIPFYVFDFRKEYKDHVFNYFLREQKAGFTPNPDIMCNLHIKFGLFLKKAMTLGFDYIATGHYVRKIQNPKTRTQKLLIAKDKNKDQSYFLALIKSDILDKIIFPIGDYTKSQVRKIAKKLKLPNALKPDSQGICFIGEVKMKSFLEKYIKPKPGIIIDALSKKKIGTHQGIWLYTIGQRKGLGISGGPYFVLEKNLEKNTLVVTKNEDDLLKKELVVQDINWLSKKIHKLPLRVKAKIRYRTQAVSATIINWLNYKSYFLVKFNKPQRAITPGQIIVFYKKDELLGGGIITNHL